MRHTPFIEIWADERMSLVLVYYIEYTKRTSPPCPYFHKESMSHRKSRDALRLQMSHNPFYQDSGSITPSMKAERVGRGYDLDPTRQNSVSTLRILSLAIPLLLQ